MSRDVIVAKINGILEEAEELPPVLQTVLASVALNYAVIYSTHSTLDSEASVQVSKKYFKPFFYCEIVFELT